MSIILIANNKKKNSLRAFCNEFCWFLSLSKQPGYEKLKKHKINMKTWRHLTGINQR